MQSGDKGSSQSTKTSLYEHDATMGGKKAQGEEMRSNKTSSKSHFPKEKKKVKSPL